MFEYLAQGTRGCTGEGHWRPFWNAQSELLTRLLEKEAHMGLRSGLPAKQYLQTFVPAYSLVKRLSEAPPGTELLQLEQEADTFLTTLSTRSQEECHDLLLRLKGTLDYVGSMSRNLEANRPEPMLTEVHLILAKALREVEWLIGRRIDALAYCLACSTDPKNERRHLKEFNRSIDDLQKHLRAHDSLAKQLTHIVGDLEYRDHQVYRVIYIEEMVARLRRDSRLSERKDRKEELERQKTRMEGVPRQHPLGLWELYRSNLSMTVNGLGVFILNPEDLDITSSIATMEKAVTAIKLFGSLPSKIDSQHLPDFDRAITDVSMFLGGLNHRLNKVAPPHQLEDLHTDLTYMLYFFYSSLQQAKEYRRRAVHMTQSTDVTPLLTAAARKVHQEYEEDYGDLLHYINRVRDDTARLRDQKNVLYAGLEVPDWLERWLFESSATSIDRPAGLRILDMCRM
jgi:hypothetical protein